MGRLWLRTMRYKQHEVDSITSLRVLEFRLVDQNMQDSTKRFEYSTERKPKRKRNCERSNCTQKRQKMTLLRSTRRMWRQPRGMDSWKSCNQECRSPLSKTDPARQKMCRYCLYRSIVSEATVKILRESQLEQEEEAPVSWSGKITAIERFQNLSTTSSSSCYWEHQMQIVHAANPVIAKETTALNSHHEWEERKKLQKQIERPF